MLTPAPSGPACVTDSHPCRPDVRSTAWKAKTTGCVYQDSKSGERSGTAAVTSGAVVSTRMVTVSFVESGPLVISQAARTATASWSNVVGSHWPSPVGIEVAASQAHVSVTGSRNQPEQSAGSGEQANVSV